MRTTEHPVSPAHLPLGKVTVNTGVDRAIELIDGFPHEPGAKGEEVPRVFAKIIVRLFPPWFDFAADKFAVLRWGRGFHLVVSGVEPGLAIISTSNSRMLACVFVGSPTEVARMDLHYKPHADQVQRAREVIALALNQLFPGREQLPPSIAALVPRGRIFPPQWDGRVDS